MPMSITPLLPVRQVVGESDGRENSLPKVKAPFVLTGMSHPRKPLLIWVWSRRGKRWMVDQELRFDATRTTI
jgi:hypothetical protein